MRALKGQGGPAKVDVAGFKERYGISRKYAIPLLEWLDRERVTRRVGDARVDPLGLGVVLAVAVGFLEVLDPLPDAAADFRQAICAENQDDDQEDDDEFRKTQTAIMALPFDYEERA